MQKLREPEIARDAWPDEIAGREFVKMHGLGNHFVIVDACERPLAVDAATVRRVCDVRTGVGAEQLVIIESPRAPTADLFMRLYNVDGREVAACGNATRCVAWLDMQQTGRSETTVETLAGLLECRAVGELRVASDMGAVRSGWRDIPLAAERDTAQLDLGIPELGAGSAVNLGNPHVVFFVADLDSTDLAVLAPLVQANPLFPEGVNVGVAEVRDETSLRLRVYERGAGLTMACGSGACAAVSVARDRGLLADADVAVELPGGTLLVRVADGRARMTGDVAVAFRGRF